MNLRPVGGRVTGGSMQGVRNGDGGHWVRAHAPEKETDEEGNEVDVMKPYGYAFWMPDPLPEEVLEIPFGARGHCPTERLEWIRDKYSKRSLDETLPDEVRAAWDKMALQCSVELSRREEGGT